MKKVSMLLIVMCGLFTFMSCDKSEDTGNHFSYDGKVYPINRVSMEELVLDDGTMDEMSIFQFEFLSITDNDTTALLIGAFDESSTTLSGNYPALAQGSDEARGIFPFGFVFGSFIVFQNDDLFVTGEGGSADLNRTGDDYSIKFKNITVGEYGDLIDSDSDGDFEFTETGSIGGYYEGYIDTVRTILSKNRVIDNNILLKLKKQAE